MKLYSCNLAHKGGTTMVLPLTRITAAEVVVLRSIHGNDAVRLLKYIGDRNVSDATEFSRLAKKYEAHTIDGKNIVEVCYPGASPQLPQEAPRTERSVNQKIVEDSKPLTKEELEAGDEMLEEAIAEDGDEEEVGEEGLPDADPDEMLDERAA